jgi:hypothetical protein
MEEMHSKLDVGTAADLTPVKAPKGGFLTPFNKVMPARSRRATKRQIPELVDVPALVAYVRNLSADVRTARPQPSDEASCTRRTSFALARRSH